MQLDRCIAAHQNKTKQNLFGIVQGGIEPHLRKICMDALIARDLPGYAIVCICASHKKKRVR